MFWYIRPTFPLLGHNLETKDPVLGEIHITLHSLLAVGSSTVTKHIPLILRVRIYKIEKKYY